MALGVPVEMGLPLAFQLCWGLVGPDIGDKHVNKVVMNSRDAEDFGAGVSHKACAFPKRRPLWCVLMGVKACRKVGQVWVPEFLWGEARGVRCGFWWGSDWRGVAWAFCRGAAVVVIGPLSVSGWECNHVGHCRGRQVKELCCSHWCRCQVEVKQKGSSSVGHVMGVSEVVEEATEMGHLSLKEEFISACSHVDGVSGKAFQLLAALLQGIKILCDGFLGGKVCSERINLEEKVANVEWASSAPSLFHNLAVSGDGRCEENYWDSASLWDCQCGRLSAHEFLELLRRVHEVCCGRWAEVGTHVLENALLEASHRREVGGPEKCHRWAAMDESQGLFRETVA